jgi:class 3 adenylate cyclase
MLMTDIEGSTALVHRLGDGYGELLDGVRALLRSATIDRAGHVVEARADDFFAVFESPHSALDTAVAIQLLLGGRSWAEDLEVRVRIGIHSGYPTLTSENYIGMAVHTTARISAVAHGGQILVSGDTKEAMQGSKPGGVRFRSLGVHRLRGLPEPVPLFQVGAPGLVARFPPTGTKISSEQT